MFDADVVVVGGGPAGSVVSALLADRGVRVMLIDRARFPRPKPCGEVVNPGAVETLARLGLRTVWDDLRPASIRGWRLATGPIVVRGDYDPARPFASGIPRRSFDTALLREAERRGVVVREGVSLTRVVVGRGAEITVRRTGRAGTTILRSQVVVGADGLRSRVARQLGLIRRAPRVRKVSLTGHVAGTGPDPERGYLNMGEGCTLGLVAVGGRDGLWNATVVLDSRRYGRMLAGCVSDILQRVLQCLGPRWTVPPTLVAGPWTCGPFDWAVRAQACRGALLVGDAAGYYDPFTGQGIFQALRTAELAAPVIAGALERGSFDRGASDSYSRAVRGLLMPTRTFQRGVDVVLRRGALRRWALERLRRAPAGADLLVGVAGDTISVGALCALPVLASGWWGGRTAVHELRLTGMRAPANWDDPHEGRAI